MDKVSIGYGILIGLGLGLAKAHYMPDPIKERGVVFQEWEKHVMVMQMCLYKGQERVAINSDENPSGIATRMMRFDKFETIPKEEPTDLENQDQ